MPDNVELNTASGGEIIATDQIGTSSGPHYQYVKLAGGTLGSTALVPGSTGGLSVLSTGTFTVVSASSGLVQVSGTATIVSASSGLIQISGTPTVTATAGTNPWSSAPGFNIPVVSVSSGLIQLSSQITVTATGPVTVTSGTVTLSSVHTVTATAGTNPWSSAPGFNIPILSASSGLVQISGTVTVLSASSGLVQISGTPTVTATAGTNPWSSAPGFNMPVVSVSSGLVQISGTPTVTATGPVTITSGTVTLSSVHTVTATAGTNPWSSAPGFNVPVVSASSGFVRAFSIGAVTSSGLTAFHSMSTGGAVATNITTAQSALYAYSIFNSTATPQVVKFYNSTAPTVGGSTANLLLTVGVPGSTGGGGANLSLPIGIYSSNGWSFVITAGMGDTDTGAPGTNNVSLGVLYQI